MNNILVRTISGTVFISLILVPLFFKDSIYATLILSAFAFLGMIEYSKLFSSSSLVSIDWRINTFFKSLIFGVITLGLYGTLGDYIAPIIFLSIPLIFSWMVIELWRKQEQPLINISISLFGFFYVSIPFILAIEINLSDFNSFPLLAGMFILIWTNDTFAFLSGKFFGKTKLFERISPKKTWEGTIGGAIFTFLMAFSLSLLFDSENLFFWLISATIIIPCAILGDLLESLFKRSLDLKDSGNIMPGHGGILDRFDAALFTLPFFYFWLLIYTYFC